MKFYALLTAMLVTSTCLLFEYECRSINVENESDKKVFLCGSQLTSVLRNLCQGNLHEHDHNKGPSGAGFPKKSKITDECCVVSCSIRFLEDNYCKKNTNPITSTPRAETTTVAKPKSWWIYPMGIGPWSID